MIWYLPVITAAAGCLLGLAVGYALGKIDGKHEVLIRVKAIYCPEEKEA